MSYNPDSVRVMTHRALVKPKSGVIGTFRLPENTVFTKQYEVAAWWTEILVPAGDYDVTTDGYWAFVKLPGKVIRAYTASLFGGVPIASSAPQYENHPSVGTEAIHHIQTYQYVAAENFAMYPNSRWIPAENIEPVLTGWCEHNWSDRRYASAMFGLTEAS